MTRLCERPGCSEPASVAYGMRPEDLVFWLDALRPEHGDLSGVLCLRHADSMVVPRNWTLDDQRDPDLHLFRPPARSAAAPSQRRAVPPKPAVEQLELDVIDEGTDDLVASDPDRVQATGTSDSTTAEPSGRVDTEPVDESSAEPWTPAAFDDDDDLDGLLSARSPLLARAFRGADRPTT